MNGRIVITGESIVSAIGIDKTSVSDSLRLQQTGIGEMRYLSSIHKELPVGEVKLSNGRTEDTLTSSSEQGC